MRPVSALTSRPCQTQTRQSVRFTVEILDAVVDPGIVRLLGSPRGHSGSRCRGDSGGRPSKDVRVWIPLWQKPSEPGATDQCRERPGARERIGNFKLRCTEV